MRQVSLEGLRSLFAQETAHAWLPALSFVPPAGYGYSQVNVVANTEGVLVGGVLYEPRPFEMVLAPDTEETVPQARIRVDNIDQSLIQMLRSVQEPMEIGLLILRVAPGAAEAAVEVGPSQFHLLAVTLDALVIEGTLGFNVDFLNEPATRDTFTPAVAPGLF